MTVITHYTNDSCTGEWLRLMADMEHEPEISIDVDPDDGYWVVGGIVKVATLAAALELAKAA
jgi:hypothetical protein